MQMQQYGKKVFICHNEVNFGPTDYAIRIIDYIGCIPVIAEKQPKLSKPVRSLVTDSMDSCDATIVIATPDRDGPNGKEPSQSVLVEIGRLQESKKFKERYIIIKEESVMLGPMIPETYYKFNNTNYSGIAEAILIELSSMGLFKNYYELPGSEINIHDLLQNLYQLKNLRKFIEPEPFNKTIEDLIRKTVDMVLKE